jgi:hypothetical protein
MVVALRRGADLRWSANLAWRLLRFFLGLGIGLACVTAAYLGLKDIYGNAHAGAVGIEASGADMSAQGVTRVVVRRRSGVVTQTCNGPCDDLRLESRHLSDSVTSIRATNVRGDCVACEEGRGDLLTGRRDDWTIAGAPRLSVTMVRRKAVAGG